MTIVQMMYDLQVRLV